MSDEPNLDDIPSVLMSQESIDEVVKRYKRIQFKKKYGMKIGKSHTKELSEN